VVAGFQVIIDGWFGVITLGRRYSRQTLSPDYNSRRRWNDCRVGSAKIFT
jgi:hypothetical protein